MILSESNFWSYYTTGGRCSTPSYVKKFSKFFLEMTPIGVKKCGESEFGSFSKRKNTSNETKRKA
jgi:hypothetical protein